jgi:hypothetical protein
MNANVRTVEAGSLSEVELDQVNGGAVPSPELLMMKEVDKAASAAGSFALLTVAMWWPFAGLPGSDGRV